MALDRFGRLDKFKPWHVDQPRPGVDIWCTHHARNDIQLMDLVVSWECRFSCEQFEHDASGEEVCQRRLQIGP